MFVGHFGVAFAARAAVPDTETRRGPSLGTWFIAAQFLDLVWPVLVIVGVEQVKIAPGITEVMPLDFENYPWSHSLVMSAVWAFVVGGLWYLARKRGGCALLVGLVVMSHWVLDWIAHRPDMPIGIHGPFVGLGLWNSRLGTILVEGMMFSVGVWLYTRSTRPLDARGRWTFACLVAALSLAYVATHFAPPPPSPAAIAWSDNGQWLLVAWAYWVDRHRRAAE
jgi:hypothetical protein